MFKGDLNRSGAISHQVSSDHDHHAILPSYQVEKKRLALVTLSNSPINSGIVETDIIHPTLTVRDTISITLLELDSYPWAPVLQKRVCRYDNTFKQSYIKPVISRLR
jgi:hypothetical protein